jgi:hypothetical protein
MNTNKAAYWVAVGALALGLNSEYRHGNFVPLHRIAGHAGAALCRVTTRAAKTLAVARFLTSPKVGLPDNLVASAGEADRAQARAEMLGERGREDAAILRDGIRDQVRDKIRAYADVIRARAEVQRAEIEVRTRSQFRFLDVSDNGVTVFCPRTAMRMARTTVARASEASSFPDIQVQVGQTF